MSVHDLSKVKWLGRDAQTTARRLESLLRELRYAYRLGAEANLDYFACGA